MAAGFCVVISLGVRIRELHLTLLFDNRLFHHNDHILLESGGRSTANLFRQLNMAAGAATGTCIAWIYTGKNRT